MRIKQLFESPQKTAVIAWGRMNPPTIGHNKVIETVKSIAQKTQGDPILFLTKTQDAKKNPLSFAEKLHFASEMFQIPIDRNSSIKTIIQALQSLQGKGYTNVAIVAGSDRIDQYQSLVDKYNNTPDTSGEIPFAFRNIRVFSSGERDADADGVEGMSASKLRKLAVEGKFEDWKDEQGKTQPGFKNGVPGNETLAKQMYNRVRQAMGIQDTQNESLTENINNAEWYVFGKDGKFVGPLDHNSAKQQAIVYPKKPPRISNTPQGFKTVIVQSASKDLQMAVRKAELSIKKLYAQQFGDVVKDLPVNMSVVKFEGRAFDAYKGQYIATVSGHIKIESKTEEAAGVGIITKQNTTKDVNKGTLKKMLKGYKLI
jgi:hypothetical protein